MIKAAELANPSSCWNKAKIDHMLFVLIQTDLAAPETIRFWVKERIRLGLNKEEDTQLREALMVADYMEASHES